VFRQSVGRPLLPVEDERLIKGVGTYVADVQRPGQLYARVVRSQVAHGWLRKVHLNDARAVAGVASVVCAEDIPRLSERRIPVRITPGPKDYLAFQTPLAYDHIRYVGEPLAVVVAVDPYVAEDAAEQVWAEVDELGPVLDPVAATQPGAPVIHEGLPDNVVGGFRLINGEDVEELFRGADLVVRERFKTHRHSAVPMETRGLVAEVDAKTARLTVWGPTKVKHFNRRLLAQLLDLPESEIRFIEPDVGGGFGARGEFYPEDFLIPWLALQLGRPVKWIEDRTENLVAMNHSREHVIEVEVAAASDGKLLAFRSTGWCAIGGYIRTTGLKVAECAATHISGPYRWRGFESKVFGVLTNKTPLGTYRGPGEVEATFARERMLDLLAAKLGIDPVELRRRNLIPVEQMPYHVDLGPEHEALDYDSGDYAAMFEALLERVDYQALRTEQAERRNRGEAVGVGIACCLDEGGYGPFEEARVVAEPEGTFTAYVGVASLGQGVQTALAQVLADELGVDVDRVRIHHHDTDLVPHGVGAFASRTTSIGGSAIQLAVKELRERAMRDGAAVLGVHEDAVEVVGDAVQALDGRSVTLAELGSEAVARFEKTTTDFSFCTSLAVVAVDRTTGRVTVERYVGAYDVGRAVNPMIVKGQLDGATAQGLGGVLLEEFAYDDQGQPLSTSFLDYLLPTIAELPEVESFWFEYAAHDNLLGVKGAGENGIIGTHATIANAVSDALAADGVSVSQLPLTANNVRKMIREATVVRAQ